MDVDLHFLMDTASRGRKDGAIDRDGIMARIGGWLVTWYQDSESREQGRSGMGDKDSRSALSDSFPAKKLHLLKVPKPSSPTSS